MPSKVSKWMLGFMREHQKFFRSSTVGSVMDVEPSPQIIEKLQLNGTRVQMLEGLQMPAMWVTPRVDTHPRKVLLHLHGGAYMSGGLLQAHVVISPICAQSGFRALTFAYRLAPEFPYPAQLEDAMRAYRYLLDLGYAADEIALVGESAGGNLALALVQKIRKEKMAQPSCLCLLSPWTDLTQTGESYVKNRDIDATLNPDTIYTSALDFVGHDEALFTDPIVSPLHADYDDFPPTQIHCGTAELLQSDAELLRDRMEQYNAKVQLIEWAGMCHVFQIFKFEESRLSNKMIGEFLRAMLLKDS